MNLSACTIFTSFILYPTIVTTSGIVADLEERLTRHNAGRSKSTKAYRPWKLVYTESFITRSEAQTREYEIKSKKSKKYVEQLVGSVIRASRWLSGRSPVRLRYSPLGRCIAAPFLFLLCTTSTFFTHLPTTVTTSGIVQI